MTRPKADEGRDYRWRLGMKRKDFARLVAALAHEVTYCNFKDEVHCHQDQDNKSGPYMEVWSDAASATSRGSTTCAQAGFVARDKREEPQRTSSKGLRDKRTNDPPNKYENQNPNNLGRGRRGASLRANACCRQRHREDRRLLHRQFHKRRSSNRKMCISSPPGAIKKSNCTRIGAHEQSRA